MFILRSRVISVMLMMMGILILPSVALSQSDTLPPHPNDTIEEPLEEEEPIYPVTYNEILARLVPAYDIYQSWDTVNIHPYKFDMGKYPDSLAICLRYAKCDYCHPFYGRVTSGFGHRRRGYHFGIDIDLNTGDSVKAAFEGRVRISKRSKTYGYVVIIRHNNGLETTYAHLSKLLVKPDQYVQAGELIGLGGNTGRSYGAHLHFEVRYKGYPINPTELIDFEKMDVIKDTFLIHRKVFKPVLDAKSAKYHTIKKGDTLGKIAKKYGTTVKALCKLNGITTKTILRPGKRLRVR